MAIHNLAFTDRELETFDSVFKVMPPLRSESDCKALRKALKDRVIDFVSSDHCPMDIEEKRMEFDLAAFGSLGLESAFGVLNGLFGLEASVEMLTRGRQRFGLPPARLQEGERALLSLFNPDLEYTPQEQDLLSASKNSMYIGKPLRGKAYGVVVGAKTNL